MRTAFRPSQLSDSHLRAAEHALRTCVHCGLCTAICPTYLLLGDERDSPRGRIVLIQNMLESFDEPSREAVLHIDRCLSCMGCRTACPSGVDYMALIDAGRAHIEKNHQRPWRDRILRAFVLRVLMRPGLFAAMAAMARMFAPLASLLPGRLGAMARKAPPKIRVNKESLATPMAGLAARRVALLNGCVQRTLAPWVDPAARRVLARAGMEAVPLNGTGCCGAVAFHLGQTELAKKCARRIIEALEKSGLEAILITATGCSAHLKEYGRLFENDEAWAARAADFSAKAKDFVELVEPAAAPSRDAALSDMAIAYHPPCSLQHAQAITGRGEELLSAAGFRLVPFADPHLCCGSAGSYSVLQPEIADALRARKLAAIEAAVSHALVFLT